MILAKSLFDLTRYAHNPLFSETEPVWAALRNLKSYMKSYEYQEALFSPCSDGTPLQESLILHEDTLLSAAECDVYYGDACKGELRITRKGSILHGASLLMAGSIFIGPQIVIGTSSLVEGGATIKAPTIIGNNTEIRQGAYMRGLCLIGDRCVVGHTTEIKHSVFLDDAKAGHFAYLGDSILGNHANLGAGTKFANLKFIPGSVKVLYKGKLLDTSMRKFGAILGDHAQTGCNSVTNPGTIIGKRGVLMPNTTAPSGYHKDRKRIR